MKRTPGVAAAAVVAAALAAAAGPAPVPRAHVRAPGHDVNGDGYADVLVGDRLFFGGPGGLAAARAFVLTAPDGHTPVHRTSAPAGDVDGDLFDDVLYGDPDCPLAKDFPECKVGHVWLYRGGAGGPSPRTPLTTLAAPGGADTKFGLTMRAAGDLNHDGHADVLLAESGSVLWLYLGGAGGLGTPPLRLPSPPGPAGAAAGSVAPFSALAALGDVDGDGYDDLAVAGFGVAIVRGGPGGLAAGAPRVLRVPDAVHESGGVSAIAGGDFDGDAFADVAIGALFDPLAADGDWGPGRVYVFRGGKGGPAAAATTVLESPGGKGTEFGSDVAAPGDLDGDSFGDLVVVASCTFGDPRAHACAGGPAHVFLGSRAGLARKPVVALAPKAKSFFVPATFLVAAGDADADGKADFVFGAFPFRGGKGGVATPAPTSL